MPASVGGKRVPPPKPTKTPGGAGSSSGGSKAASSPVDTTAGGGGAGGTAWYALPVSQGFYWTPSNTKAHSGIDLATGVGRPITAPFDGVQISEGSEPWGGQENLRVTDAGGNTEVLSWLHMSSESPIGPGTQVKAGTLLGYSGTPPAGYGNGPHIHFERTMGGTPPYMGYNPWYPSSKSYPVNPQPVLNELKAGGEGGTLGGSGGGIFPSFGSGPGGAGGSGGSGLGGLDTGLGSNAGGLPSLISVDLTGFQTAIQNDLTTATTDIVDGLKRAGVFVIGLILAIVGLYVIFKPQIQDAADAMGQQIGGLSEAVTGGIKSAAAGSKATAAGAAKAAQGSLAELGDLAAI